MKLKNLRESPEGIPGILYVMTPNDFRKFVMSQGLRGGCELEANPRHEHNVDVWRVHVEGIPTVSKGENYFIQQDISPDRISLVNSTNLSEGANYDHRCWINPRTGKILDIEDQGSHGRSIMDNKALFGVPSGETFMRDEEFDIDLCLFTAYKNGWIRVGSDEAETIFTGIDMDTIRAAMKLLITRYPEINLVHVGLDTEEGPSGTIHELSGNQIDQFIRTGKIPKKLSETSRPRLKDAYDRLERGGWRKTGSGRYATVWSKRFKNITEKRFATAQGQTYWLNPSPQEFMGNLKQYRELRGLCVPENGDVYFWPAMSGTHGEMSRTLMTEKSPGVNHSGMLWLYVSEDELPQADDAWQGAMNPIGPVWMGGFYQRKDVNPAEFDSPRLKALCGRLQLLKTITEGNILQDRVQLFHVTEKRFQNEILLQGIRPTSYWCTGDVVDYYMGEQENPIVFQVPLGRFKQSQFDVDRPGIQEPVVPVKDIAKKWAKSSKDWHASLDLVGSVTYGDIMRVTPEDIHLKEAINESEEFLPSKFFWHPVRGIEGEGSLHHTEMLWANPELFGLTPGDIEESRKVHTAYPPYDGVLMRKAFDQGWVRVARALGTFTMEANTVREVFECAVWCVDRHQIERLYFDAEFKHASLMGNPLERFLRTGRVMQGAFESLTETAHTTMGGLEYLVDPGARELAAHIEYAENRTLRGVMMGGHSYWWDAHDTTHDWGVLQLHSDGVRFNPPSSGYGVGEADARLLISATPEGITAADGSPRMCQHVGPYLLLWSGSGKYQNAPQDGAFGTMTKGLERIGRTMVESLMEKFQNYGGFEVLENPTVDEVLGWINQYGSLRGMCLGQDVFLWDAHEAIHGQGVDHLHDHAGVSGWGLSFVFMKDPNTAVVRGNENMVDLYWVNHAQQVGPVWFSRDMTSHYHENDRLKFILQGLARKSPIGESLYDSHMKRVSSRERITTSMAFWFHPNRQELIQVQGSHASIAVGLLGHEPHEDDGSDEGQEALKVEMWAQGWVRGIVSPAELELNGPSYKEIRIAGRYLMDRLDYIPKRFDIETSHDEPLTLDPEQFNDFLKGKARNFVGEGVEKIGGATVWVESSKIAEKRMTSPNVSEYLVNPMSRELIGFVNRHSECRGYLSNAGDVYVWPAQTDVHDDFVAKMVEEGVFPPEEERMTLGYDMGPRGKEPRKILRLYFAKQQQTQNEQSWGRYAIQVGPLWVSAYNAGGSIPNYREFTPQTLRGWSDRFDALLSRLSAIPVPQQVQESFGGFSKGAFWVSPEGRVEEVQPIGDDYDHVEHISPGYREDMASQYGDDPYADEIEDWRQDRKKEYLVQGWIRAEYTDSGKLLLEGYDLWLIQRAAKLLLSPSANGILIDTDKESFAYDAHEIDRFLKKRFKMDDQYRGISESRVMFSKVSPDTRKRWSIIQDPTQGQIKGQFARAEEGILRGWIEFNNGHFYVWDAYQAEHDAVINDLLRGHIHTGLPIELELSDTGSVEVIVPTVHRNEMDDYVSDCRNNAAFTRALPNAEFKVLYENVVEDILNEPGEICVINPRVIKMVNAERIPFRESREPIHLKKIFGVHQNRDDIDLIVDPSRAEFSGLMKNCKVARGLCVRDDKQVEHLVMWDGHHATHFPVAHYIREEWGWTNWYQFEIGTPDDLSSYFQRVGPYTYAGPDSFFETPLGRWIKSTKESRVVEDILNEVTPRLRVTDKMRNSARGNNSQVMVEMPPEDFLKLTTGKMVDVDQIGSEAKSLVQYNRYTKAGHSDKYRDFLNRGKTKADQDYTWGSSQHPMLVIEISEQGGKIIGRVSTHEGRHRAAAYMKKGGKAYPVAIQLRGDIRVPGSPNYDSSKWWYNKDYLPGMVKSQYSEEWVNTSHWKVTADQPLRRVQEGVDRIDAAIKSVASRHDGFSGNCGDFAYALKTALGSGDYLAADSGDHYEYVDHIALRYRGKIYDGSGLISAGELKRYGEITDYGSDDSVRHMVDPGSLGATLDIPQLVKELTQALIPITEKFVNGEIPYWKNPGKQELLGALQRYHELRGIISKENVFFWPAENVTHGQGWNYLQTQGEIVGERKVVFAFASDQPACHADPVWSQRLQHGQTGPIWLATSSMGFAPGNPHEEYNAPWGALIRTLKGNSINEVNLVNLNWAKKLSTSLPNDQQKRYKQTLEDAVEYPEHGVRVGIIKVDWNDPDATSKELGLRDMGNSDGNAYRMIAIMRGKNIIGLANIEIPRALHGRYWTINTPRIKPAYRGKGLGILFYEYAIKHKKMNIVSHDQQTPGSKMIWSVLAQKPDYQVVARDWSEQEYPVLVQGGDILAHGESVYANDQIEFLVCRAGINEEFEPETPNDVKDFVDLLGSQL